MKKTICLFLIFFMLGCAYPENHQRFNDKEKEELRTDTKILKSLNDSLNLTGNHLYFNKYILKIDEMIKKYPDQKGLIKVKENMIEIFGASLK